MTTLFFFICEVSVVFFGVFLVECSRPRDKSRKEPVIRKVPELAAVDSAAGRRFFVHLEEQMAHFIAVHRRTAAILLIATAMMPLIARAQESSGLSADLQANATDQSIPPVSGPGKVTPPGGNTGTPGSVVPGFIPDLVKTQNTLDMAIMVMF